MSLTLTPQDKITMRTAAWGSISLMAAADAAGRPHRAATHGSIALASATGLTGHVLAEWPKGVNLRGKSVAELADLVLPALTATMSLLNKRDPAEAHNFRRTVVVAIEAAARVHQGEPRPPVAEMLRKITAALDAA
ncbi:hypothetical protein [Nonomuraea gerenzanensis]|uniref:D-alanyl-D-alanine carboxypeptidase n=1 Tax=Nonomuraea gerenzanensis TaxID=93944 RepID=A0A1M4EQX0_9ACTN|nr:hypothetical protein [Nonomuraea gerenzanensis]UBU12682.1 hypothetical protein LCN96_51905 [Nonomuraea gerenzanensis]SBP01239.1 D-alanyl-D-alanine carboxypeptidase [Nonomuraea gerenzanensis]